MHRSKYAFVPSYGSDDRYHIRNSLEIQASNSPSVFTVVKVARHWVVGLIFPEHGYEGSVRIRAIDSASEGTS